MSSLGFAGHQDLPRLATFVRSIERASHGALSLQKRTFYIHHIPIGDIFFVPYIGFDGEEVGAVFGGEKGSIPAGFPERGLDADKLKTDLLFALGGVFDLPREFFGDVHKVPGCISLPAPDFPLYLEVLHESDATGIVLETQIAQLIREGNIALSKQLSRHRSPLQREVPQS